MKKVARASFMVIGAPNLISFAVVTVVVWIMAPAIPEGRRQAFLQAGEVVSGFVSVFASILLAQLLGIKAGFCVFSVTVAWFLIHFMRLNRMPAFWRSASGVILGLLCDVLLSGF